MELKHHFVVPSSLEDTWHSFNQLEDIAPCFPGATLTSVSDEQFTGTVKVKLGPIAMIYTGTGEFLERNQETHTVVISATGKDKRGNGTAGATVTAVLTPDGDGTSVDVTTDMNVTGKPAQFGRGVIQDISDKLLEQFVQCVIGKAGGGAEEDTEPDVGVAVEPGEPGAAESGEPAAVRPAARSAAQVVEPPGAPVPAAAAAPAPLSAPFAPSSELDLGSAVWPVLVRRFGPVLCAGAVLAVVVWLARRRRRD
ncbi:SRPBCC family protein [Arthrobacter sp. FW306-2-2C-D06B]|uniref:SRPBCC family protein n=1 Tax=Arthrobacter sp. FW306-2-2C-D06B TaxID=2879618 RepID=UPI001F1F5344|nr:SRPBCC family protein [Arthrobacter sp. FW306-2-2C-D06B]UKA59303.1 SRPBCC family protein [Arthrobacter sp. FW306-2-2C-D06B]